MSDSVPQQRQGWEGEIYHDTQIVAETLKEAGAPRQTASVKEAVEKKNPTPVAPETLGRNKSGKTAS